MAAGGAEVSLVIEMSPFAESPAKALASADAVFEAGLIDEVHIVRQGNYLAPALLAKHKFPVIYHTDGVLDLRKLKHMAMVRTPGDLEFSRAAFERILEDMRAGAGRYFNYAVGSLTIIHYEHNFFTNFFYGYLLVLGVMDYIRSALNLSRYALSFDLRASYLMRSFPDRVVELRPSRWRWGVFSSIFPTRRMDGGCHLVPEERDMGLRFVRRAIYTHPYMGPGIWMAFFAAYALLVAPGEAQLLASGKELLSRSVWNLARIIQLLLISYVAYQEIYGPPNYMVIVYVVAFPFYVMTFPLVYVMSRFMKPRHRYSFDNRQK